MNDLSADFSASEPLSTSLDTDTPNGPSGGGAPRTLETEAKEPSLRDTISAVVKEDAASREKVDAKPDAKDPEAKPEKTRAPDGKFAGKDEKPAEAKADPLPDEQQQAESERAEQRDERPSEGRKYPEPPARFQPAAKQVWRNTPHAVQQEIERMSKDHEGEVTRYRESHERYENVREYDEIARSNGRDLRQSLAKVVEIEDALAKNPIAGLDRILQEVGPRKANGQAYTLFEVAQHVVGQGPQAYQQMSTQAQQEQSQGRVQQLEQTIAKMQQEQQSQALANQIIAPFVAANPRYHELEDDIALFLQSGRIDPSLSPAEKLASAYDMAERLNPPSHAAVAPSPDPEPDVRAAPSFSGSKSIKSAPGAISEDLEPERGGSIREILEQETKRLKAR